MSQKLWLEPQGVWAQLGPCCYPHSARRLWEKRHRPPCVPRSSRGGESQRVPGKQDARGYRISFSISAEKKKRPLGFWQDLCIWR